MEGESSGLTTTLMVVAVLAMVVSGVSVFLNLQKASTGFASNIGQGNVTLEIAQLIDINFSRNLINWSSGYVNVTPPCVSGFAYLNTNDSVNPTICGALWNPQTNGLILEGLSTLPIAINLSSNVNSTTLIDGVGNNYGSTFRWKVQEFNSAGVSEPLTCDATLAPIAYTDIVQGQSVRVCNQTNFQSDRDELRIDFWLNISQSAPAQTGYRTAVITATGYLP